MRRCSKDEFALVKYTATTIITTTLQFKDDNDDDKTSSIGVLVLKNERLPFEADAFSVVVIRLTFESFCEFSSPL